MDHLKGPTHSKMKILVPCDQWSSGGHDPHWTSDFLQTAPKRYDGRAEVQAGGVRE